MKLLYKRIFAFLFVLLILNQNSIGVADAYRSNKHKIKEKVLKGKTSRFNGLLALNADEETPYRNESGLFSNFKPESEFYRYTLHSSSRLAKSHTNMIPVLPFFILKFVAKTITSVANSFTAKLKEEIAALRSSMRDTLKQQVTDVELILANNCLFYKYLKFLSFSFINSVNFQISIFQGVEVVPSSKTKTGKPSRYADLFKNKLPKMLRSIQTVQDNIKSKLEKKVSKACSKDLEFGAEYLAFAKQEIEVIESQIESDAEENEENGFSVMNWIESKVRKSSKSQKNGQEFQTKIDDKIKIIKAAQDESYQGLVDDIAGENEEEDDSEDTPTTSSETNSSNSENSGDGKAEAEAGESTSEKKEKIENPLENYFETTQKIFETYSSVNEIGGLIMNIRKAKPDPNKNATGNILVKVKSYLTLGFKIYKIIMFVLDWVGVGFSPIVKSWLAVGDQVYEVINAALAWRAEANSLNPTEPAQIKKIKDARFEFFYQVMVLTGTVLVAVALTSFAAAIGPIVDSLIATFDAIRAIYNLVKAWKLRNSERKKAGAINSTTGLLTGIIRNYYQFKRCQTVGFLYDQFQTQDKYLRRIEDLCANYKFESDEAKSIYNNNIYKFLRRSCSENVSMCLNSYSETFIKKTVGNKRGQTILNLATNWALSGPISSITVVNSSEDLAQLLTLGYRVYIELTSSQKILVCRGCSNTNALVDVQVLKKGSSEELKAKIETLKQVSRSGSREVQVYSFSLKNSPSDQSEPQDVEFYLLAADYPLSRTASGDTKTLPLVVDFTFDIVLGDEVTVTPVLKTHQGERFKGVDENEVEYASEDKIYEFNSGRVSNKGITHLFVASNKEPSCLSGIRDKILLQVTATENLWGIKQAVLSDRDISDCKKFYKFNLSTYKINSVSSVFEFQLDILENSDAYAKSDFSPLSDLLMYLPLDEENNRFAYSIFYKSIFKQETLEEYSAMTVVDENKQIRLTKFSQNNEMYKYLRSYLCQRVVDYEEKVMASQCYFKDDPLNRIVEDLYIKNYERNLINIDYTALAQDKRLIVKSFVDLANTEIIYTYSELKSKLYKILSDHASINVTPSTASLFASILAIIQNTDAKTRFSKALNGNPFEIMFPVKFKKNCRAISSHYVLELIDNELEEKCSNFNAGSENIPIENIYYLRLVFGRKKSASLKEEEDKFFETFDKFKGYTPLPSFSASGITVTHFFSADEEFGVETFVKPSFDTGYVPLSGLVTNSATKLTVDQVQAYKTTFTKITDPIQGKTPYQYHTLFFSHFNNYPNNLMTLANARTKLEGFMKSPLKEETKFEPLQAKSKLKVYFKTCDGSTTFLPLRLKKAGNQLKFKTDADKNFEYLEEVEPVTVDEEDEKIDSIYYVEIICQEYSSQVLVDASESNYQKLFQYGFRPVYSPSRPLVNKDKPCNKNKLEDGYCNDGALRQVSKEMKHVIAFRLWVRTDMRIANLYGNICSSA